jgi:hypothetical protein
MNQETDQSPSRTSPADDFSAWYVFNVFINMTSDQLELLSKRSRKTLAFFLNIGVVSQELALELRMVLNILREHCPWLLQVLQAR